jgi:DNA topoisomerase VI subunit A
MAFQSLEPITRNELQSMKSVFDEEKRKQKLQSILTNIYRQVKDNASTTTRNKYYATINQDMLFIKQNIDEIMSELQRLFPDSRVTFSKVKHTREGYVEVSEAEERMLELMNQKNTEPAIVIDWS